MGQKKFGSEILLGQKIGIGIFFGSKKIKLEIFLSQKNLCRKNLGLTFFWVQKNVGRKFFWVKKMWVENFFGSQKIWVGIFFWQESSCWVKIRLHTEFG